jgi:hypothetical protein
MDYSLLEMFLEAEWNVDLCGVEFLFIHVLKSLISCWQIITTITVDEFAPGTKGILSFTIPDHNSGKVSVSFNACVQLDYSCVLVVVGSFIFEAVPLLDSLLIWNLLVFG